MVELVDGSHVNMSQDYFRFMFEPGVDPTNNHGEQKVRHCVIDRRTTRHSQRVCPPHSRDSIEKNSVRLEVFTSPLKARRRLRVRVRGREWSRFCGVGVLAFSPVSFCVGHDWRRCRWGSGAGVLLEGEHRSLVFEYAHEKTRGADLAPRVRLSNTPGKNRLLV